MFHVTIDTDKTTAENGDKLKKSNHKTKMLLFRNMLLCNFNTLIHIASRCKAQSVQALPHCFASLRLDTSLQSNEHNYLRQQ